MSEEWDISDLEVGKSYQSRFGGIVTYRGIDRYYGHMTFIFDCENGRTTYQLPHNLNKFLGQKPGTTISCSTDEVQMQRGTELAEKRLTLYASALSDIAFSDDVDNALDPERNKRVARAAIGAAASGAAPDAPPFTFSYRNYRGETSVRRVIPLFPRFGSNQWHTEPQWLLHAIDLDKGEERQFAMKDMAPAQPDAVGTGPCGKIEVDTDLARRCLEALDWHRTGLLDDGAMRSFAATQGLNAQYGDDLGVRKAEDITARQAMAFVVHIALQKRA
jgi:hypothetical protein